MVQGTLAVPYATSGLYDVTSGRVAAVDTAKNADDGRNRAAFIAELRAAARR